MAYVVCNKFTKFSEKWRKIDNWIIGRQFSSSELRKSNSIILVPTSLVLFSWGFAFLGSVFNLLASGSWPFLKLTNPHTRNSQQKYEIGREKNWKYNNMNDSDPLLHFCIVSPIIFLFLKNLNSCWHATQKCNREFELNSTTHEIPYLLFSALLFCGRGRLVDLFVTLGSIFAVVLVYWPVTQEHIMVLHFLFKRTKNAGNQNAKGLTNQAKFNQHLIFWMN